jgi:hypothetical protein
MLNPLPAAVPVTIFEPSVTEEDEDMKLGGGPICSYYRVRFCRRFLAGILISMWVTTGNSGLQADPVLDPVLWLRADAGVTTDGSGGVSAWADQSGAGHDASQAAPLSRAQLAPGVLNGNPVLHFNGNTSFFNVTGQVLTSQRFTIFTVVNDLGLSDFAFREVFSNWNPISNEATSVFFGLAHENPARARLTDNFGGADPPYSQQGVGEITNPATHFIFTGISGLTDALIYQNTDLIAEKGSPLTTRNLVAPYHIGQQGPEGLLEHWNGDIAEILVYDRELSAAERQQVWNYLGEKYFAAPVPEPSTLALLGIGTLGLIGWAWQWRKLAAA